MKIWKYTVLDGILFSFSLLQFIFMSWLACYWQLLSLSMQIGLFSLLVGLITYNIIIISHLFTHTPWFCSKLLNSAVSMLNTVNIGQSVQMYQLQHVRNHHRYNNDAKGPFGKTKDLTSTFLKGRQDQHANLLHYAFGGALSTFLKDTFNLPLILKKLFSLRKEEVELVNLLSPSPQQKQRELIQLVWDRAAYLCTVSLFLVISWKWLFFCYFPAMYLAFVLVNIQNYYEHYGANPLSKVANSVSYYGRLYNYLTFNDGFHQEHHLSYGAHWTLMPEVRKNHHEILSNTARIISPLPAILGFLDRKRKLLHMSNNEQTEDMVIGEEFSHD